MTSPPTTGPSGVRFRVARRGDATPLVTMLTEAGATTADSHTLAWIISHPEMEILVATDLSDKVIGVVSLSHRPILHMGGRCGTIDELVVTPSWRGKGVGGELLRRAVERARVLSVKRLEIQSAGPLSETATRFFESCGFAQSNVALFRLT